MPNGWPAGRMLGRRAGLGAWPAQRVGLAAVVGGLLLSAVLLGHVAPLLAQEGVGIAFDDLTSQPTHTTVHRFGVELSNLDAATTYAVVVASDNATALGIGACGTAAQAQTVTGVTAQDLAIVVYACALGSGTLTAEVRAAGAATAAATVSRALTVLAIPEGAPPGVPGAAPASAATRGATKAGTPGIVPNVRFDNVTSTSARARWDKPSNGGRTLTGFGLLMWTGPDHPNYGDAFVVGKDSRSHTYTGLQAGATYKFRIHACNDTDSCGHWTHPPKEVRLPTPTATATPTPTPTRTATTAPPATTPGPVRNLTHSGSGKHTVSVDWDAPSSSRGGATLTGYHVQHKAEGTRDWPDGSAVVTPGTTTAWTIRGLINGTRYNVQVRACNAASRCGTWVELTGTATAGNKVGNASLIPSSADLTIGQRQKFEIHDIPVGKTARTYLVGPIQPEGRCGSSGATAQARGPSTGPGYYDSLRIEGCAPGGTGWLRVVNADESELYASAKITVQAATHPGQVGQPTVDARDAALYVDWTAPGDGGAAISHHDIRYRAGTSGSWTQTRVPPTATETVPTDMTVSSLSNGTAYQVEVRACNTHGCGDWSPTATGTPSAALGEPPETSPPGATPSPPSCDSLPQSPPPVPASLDAPTNLDLTPALTTRHAQLAWAPVSGAAKYKVEIRRLEQGRWGAWGAPDLSGSSTNSGEVTNATCYDINLDHIVQMLSDRGLANSTRGLGTNVAFGFKVKAINGVRESDFSNEVIVIDFSRAYANGDSRGYPVAGQGQSEVNWQRADQVLGSNYRSGQYSFRYRELRHKSGPGANSLIHHSDPSWQPNAYVTIDTTTDNPKTGLTLGTIYGVQIRLDNTGPGGTTSVYAARDIYAWPHHESTYYRRHVVATHDFEWPPIFRATSSETIVYRYRICTDSFTFPAYTKPGSSTSYKAGDPTQWVPYINHALRQWQYATNGLVQMIHEVDAQGNSLPCSNTLEFLTAIADEYNKRKGKGESASDIDTHITNYLKTLKEEGIKGRRLGKALAKDLQLNEILMVDNVSGSFATFPHRVFRNVSAHVGIPYCSTGCAVVEEHVDPERPLGRLVRTADIYLNRLSHWSEKQTFVDLRVVDQIRLSTCPNTKPDNREEQYHRPYATLVHESGHALGLAHPTNLGPIMSHTRGVPQCSPHPFDVLALMALYQSRGTRSA